MVALIGAILESVKRRRLYVVYHFIPLQYLPNVFRRGGLWCAQQLREWGDDFDDDRQKWGWIEKGEALSGYVACSVNAPWGMLTPDKRPVLLELNSPILGTPNAVFIGKWSSHRDVDADACLEQTGVTYFDNMFLNKYKSFAEPQPGEFFVPRHIPLSYVRSVVFYRNEDRRDFNTAINKMSWPDGFPRGNITAQVSPSKFGNKMQRLAEEGS